METRVFYFTGILGSGKTTFIDQTIGDLEEGQTSVVICAEVGDEDITNDVPVIYTDKLDRRLFEKVDEEYSPDIVFIEDDGTRFPDMFLLTREFPKNWTLVQVVCMMNARTFEHYMIKTPNMIMDKVRPATMIIINRCTDELAEFIRDQNLRMVNRQAEIWFEFEDGHIENYIREGESAFDLSEGELFLDDDSFPVWYVEALDYPDRFENVTINVELMVDKEKPVDETYDVVGRWMMTCCAADLQFFPIACRKGMLEEFEDEDIVEITAIVHKGEWYIYEGEGPVLEIIDVKKVR